MRTSIVEVNNLEPDVLFALVDLFGYFIKDVPGYDKLPDEIKNIISRDTFNKMTINS